MHHYQVTFIGESDLPEGHDWAVVRRDDAYQLFVNAAAPGALRECWAEFSAWVREAPADPLPIPAQRPSVTALPSGSRA